MRDPSDVILAGQFARRFDGSSIGSDVLTQLFLCADGDGEDLAGPFDEWHEAVNSMIADIIRKAHGAGIKVGICGQGPGDHPDSAAFLVREGINSQTVNPDGFLHTVHTVAQAESLA